mmetsp:Transcript_30475/g.81206  ORF Transcript_30475/g.81206 Transcript_30475/m.81206 type:complete len:134 (+) Transcript_30475:1219-1620(+)
MFNGSGWTLSWLPDTTSVVGVYNLVDFPDVIVAATEGGRIWRSSNAGENFTLVADFSQQGISFSGISGEGDATARALRRTSRFLGERENVGAAPWPCRMSHSVLVFVNCGGSVCRGWCFSSFAGMGNVPKLRP